MKKLAIFVEGNTELVFIEKLVIEVASFQNVNIAKQSLHGDSIRCLYDSGVDIALAKYHVLIVDCQCDGKVKSAILDRKELLTKKGYECVLGIRDAYPHLKRSDLNKGRKRLQVGLDTFSMPVHIVLAVMEIEAWFLGEWTHLARVDKNLTSARVHEVLGFDLITTSAERIDKPAQFLSQAYGIVGRQYRKKDHDAHSVASRLDYAQLYAATRTSHPSLDELLTHMDTFFSA